MLKQLYQSSMKTFMIIAKKKIVYVSGNQTEFPKNFPFNVLVCYLSLSKPLRQSELLTNMESSLW